MWHSSKYSMCHAGCRFRKSMLNGDCEYLFVFLDSDKNYSFLSSYFSFNIEPEAWQFIYEFPAHPIITHCNIIVHHNKVLKFHILLDWAISQFSMIYPQSAAREFLLIPYYIYFCMVSQIEDIALTKACKIKKTF